MFSNKEIKSLLKKNRHIYNANALWKAAGLRRKSERIERKYRSMAAQRNTVYRAGDIPQMVQRRIAERGISLPGRNEPLRIYWIGANKEQDYSGFVQGLERFGQVICHHNAQGKYGQEFSADRYDPRIVEKNDEQLLAALKREYCGGHKIHILIGQMWANYISKDALREAQNKGIVTINIAMDDRLPELWETYRGVALGSAGLAGGLDLVLTSSPECCSRYLLHDCPAIFWPMASDPDLFKPAAIKDIDVCFVGNNYGNRGSTIRRLQRSGIQVEAYGSGWPNGYIGPDKIATVFGRSRIILGIGTVAYSRDIFTLKLRDFDATMSGALYLTHRNPDLLALFEEGKEIECYRDESEAVEKITYYLSHPEECSRIGMAAAAKARTYHTWERRIAEAFATVGYRRTDTAFSPENTPRPCL